MQRSDAVLFHAPAGLPVEARLVDVSGGDQPTVTVELPPEVWDTVDLFNLFRLEPKYRLVGRVSGDRPVRVELRPAAPGGVADLGARLVDLSASDPGDALLDTENWCALTVTEVVRDDGTNLVRSGFATRWLDGTADHPLLAELTEFFTAREVPIERVDDPAPALTGEGDGANGSWRLTVRADETGRVVTIESAAAERAGAIVDRFPVGQLPLDNDAFADFLGDHLARMDDQLAR